MKKVLFIILCASLLFGSFAYAVDFGGGKLGDIFEKAGGTRGATLEAEVGDIIAAVLGLLGTIFLVLTIYAGILWMTAIGDEGKIDKAKEILTSAVIGLAIVVSAYTITYFVGSRINQAPPSTEQQ